MSIANASRVISLKSQFFLLINKTLTVQNNIYFTLGLLFIPSLIGWSYPKANDWISLIGALCQIPLSVTLPGIMGIQMYYRERRNKMVI